MEIGGEVLGVLQSLEADRWTDATLIECRWSDYGGVIGLISGHQWNVDRFIIHFF